MDKNKTAMNDASMRVENNPMSDVSVCAIKLLGVQSHRSLEHSSLGMDLIPREMISAYAIQKKLPTRIMMIGGTDCEHHTYDVPLSQSSLG
jgi:fumarate hydratase class II